MLYQDTLTGMLHEVPDSQVNGWGLAEDPYGVGEGQVIYDGLGNPLGWGFLKKLVKKAMPFATSMLGPYGQIIKHALPVVSRALAQPQLSGIPVGLPRPGALSPMPIRPPWPAGWRRPQLPYTGPQPRRLYMRCSVWPGPKGLVPVNAAQTPVAMPQAAAAVAAQTAAARGVMRRRVRGRRR